MFVAIVEMAGAFLATAFLFLLTVAIHWHSVRSNMGEDGDDRPD